MNKEVLPDLSKKLKLFKEMNLDNAKMELSENHKLIFTIFDEFNNLLNNKFDCYYTGGLMLYIITKHDLERYHNDLDLFINENQLIELKSLVDKSNNFSFISNMDKKGVNGHEYKIIYKDFPISIGLFIFERKEDGGLITKKYYYEDLYERRQLYLDERHFNIKYKELVFNDSIYIHNNEQYKAVSLEYIYYSKKNSRPFRPKDAYDMRYICDKIDMNLVKAIDIEKQGKIDICHKKSDNSIIKKLEYSQ